MSATVVALEHKIKIRHEDVNGCWWAIWAWNVDQEKYDRVCQHTSQFDAQQCVNGETVCSGWRGHFHYIPISA